MIGEAALAAVHVVAFAAVVTGVPYRVLRWCWRVGVAYLDVEPVGGERVP